MSESTPHGPVDFLLLEFPPDRPTDAVADELFSLVEQGTIALYDLLVLRKEGDGSVTVVDIEDVTIDGPAAVSFARFSGARSGLLAGEDVETAGSVMEPGTTAALLVYENTWAVPFVAATLDAGGEAVASMRIPATDIMAALDELGEA